MVMKIMKMQNQKFNDVTLRYSIWSCSIFDSEKSIKPRRTKGVATTPLENFYLPPQNQNESDQSHLGKLTYILCGYFDEKKMGGGYPFKCGRVSRQGSGRGGGVVVNLENFKSPFWKISAYYAAETYSIY